MVDVAASSNMTSKIRWSRVALAVAAAFAVAAAVRFAYNLWLIVTTSPESLGIDLTLYLDATRRWLDGGSFYQTWQLGGPYEIVGAGEILYPPYLIYLMLPFTVLPAVLWWLVPIGATAAFVWHVRPGWQAGPLIAALIWWPRTQEIVFWGNPVMWLVPAVGWGLLVGWPAVGVLVKPSLLPFALVGVGHRSWWVGLAVAGLAAIPLAGLWNDWVDAVTSATNARLLYSIVDVPTLLLPIAAWFWSRERPTEIAAWLDQRARPPAPFRGR